MKRNRLAVLAVMVILAALALAACGGETEAEIRLESNASTGYSWVYSAEPDGVVSVVSSDYVEPDGGEAGTPGEQVFVLRGESEGDAVLTFEYLREWEEGATPEDTIIYNVHVNADKTLELAG